MTEPSGRPASSGVAGTLEPVPGVPEDFIVGADISTVLSLEQSGVVFRDRDGRPTPLERILAAAGFTDIRVRVWNDPYSADGRQYGGGTLDVDRAIRIGRRATDAGLRVLVDFHYSDFWADPEKQRPPKAWEGLPLGRKAEALHDFTLDALERFAIAGVDVRMVQVGNETNDFLCGEREWPAIAELLAAGSRAVRTATPDALVAVHFANPETPGRYERYVDELLRHGIDYDVFASSYYPFWHGSPEHLVEVLRRVVLATGKRVVIAETAWPYTDRGSGDGQPNLLTTVGDADTDRYPMTVHGQQLAMRDVVAAVVELGGLGLYYWEPAWLPVGPAGQVEENRRRWEEHGSGWATTAAGEFDPEAAERPGGTEWDEQALFAPHGMPLPSLDAFQALLGRRN